MTYVTVEGRDRVPGIEPDLRTWFYGRALRRRDKLNERRIFPSYRWEVVKDGSRWLVVAFQNYARPV